MVLVTGNPTGGTPPYYLFLGAIWRKWTNKLNNLAAGDYLVTITDNRNCIETFDVTITEPESIISGVGFKCFLW